jgi:hypothetical protein
MAMLWLFIRLNLWSLRLSRAERHDGAVGPQTKMFHDLLVVHGVTNVDIPEAMSGDFLKWGYPKMNGL